MVVLLTPGSGQVRLVARRARSLRGTIAQAMEPLALVRVSYYQRPGAELATLGEAVLRRSSFALAGRPEAWAAAQVVVELALVHCPPGQPAAEAFRLADHCLEHLSTGGDAATAVHYAELWFLRLGGVLPAPERCGRCERPLGSGPLIYDRTERQLVCEEHRPLGGAEELPEAAARWLRLALRSRLDALGGPAPSPLPAWLEELHRQHSERELATLSFFYSLTDSGSRRRGPGAR